jgi:hypothetical protein
VSIPIRSVVYVQSDGQASHEVLLLHVHKAYLLSKNHLQRVVEERRADYFGLIIQNRAEAAASVCCCLLLDLLSIATANEWAIPPVIDVVDLWEFHKVLLEDEEDL